MAVLNDNFIAVARIVSAEPFGVDSLHDTGDGLLQNVCLQRHVMVSDDIDQLDAAGDHVVQLINHVLIVGDNVHVKLSLIRIAGIIDREIPFIEKIARDHQFPHISCILQAL
ncbi:hypothetical protein SDC9_103189 [bioreactor metagenome]|uniref:Uncharacterized protein n=1 Tax=bioreactor metagenome TaxID=1076179 RepID=A0A645ATI4_9ZZZZ